MKLDKKAMMISQYVIYQYLICLNLLLILPPTGSEVDHDSDLVVSNLEMHQLRYIS